MSRTLRIISRRIFFQDTMSLYQDATYMFKTLSTCSRHLFKTLSHYIKTPIQDAIYLFKTPFQDDISVYQDTFSRRYLSISRHPFKTLSTCSRRYPPFSRHPFKTLLNRIKTLFNRIKTNLRLRWSQSRRTDLSPECNATFASLLHLVRCIYAHGSLPTEYLMYVDFPLHWCCGTDTFLPT